MTTRIDDIIYLTDVAMITCVVNTERAEAVLMAGQQAGARGALGHQAQGWGARQRLGALGLAVETERSVITFIVSTEQQDAVFNTIYRAGRLDEPEGGFMYVTHLDKAATYIPSAIRRRLGIE